MRRSVLSLLAAAVLAGGVGVLLVGCSFDPADQSAPPTATESRSLDPTTVPLPPTTASDRPPLGLEVRYVDGNGEFATLTPEDFPR
jgi:hypothetical protein